jgi:hypothetical protein
LIIHLVHKASNVKVIGFFSLRKVGIIEISNMGVFSIYIIRMSIDNQYQLYYSTESKEIIVLVCDSTFKLYSYYISNDLPKL